MTGRELADRFDAWQRRTPLAAFALAVQRKFASDRGGRLAAALAYYAFLSIFPAMLVFVTVLGYLLASHGDLRHQLLDSAIAQFPVIGSALRDERQLRPLRGNVAAFVIGVAGALWSGMRAMQIAQDAMNDVWEIPLRDRPRFVQKRVRAVLMLALIGTALALTVALSNVAALLAVAWLTRSALVIASVVANVATFALAFQILTANRLRWRDVMPGAVLAGIGWLGVQLLGTWFVTRVVKGASDVYGTFATVIGFLTLFFVQAQLTLWAAEVNVVRSRGLWPRSLTGRNLTDADRRALLDEAASSVRHVGQHVSVRFDGDASAVERTTSPTRR